MIVAFDPGVTTGVAWLDEKAEFHAAQFDEAELYDWVDEHAFLFEHMQIEQFIINEGTMRKSRVYDSLYIIGYLKYVQYRAKNTVSIGWTKPADVMAAFPDVALKRAKMHTPGKVHANDASRHLAYFMVRSGRVSGSIFLPK